MSNNFTETFADGLALTQSNLETALQTLTLDLANTTQMTTSSISGQVLTSSGSASAATWTNIDSPWATVENIGVAASINANALTLSLTARDGSALSSTNRGRIAFRDVTLANGRYTTVTLTNIVSLVIPSGATLGKQDATAGYVYLYAMNFGGTVELVVAGSPFGQEKLLNSTTAISSSSTSNATLYSSSARTNLPLRFLGRLKISNTTAGSYASLPSEIALWPMADALISPTETYLPAITNGGTHTLGVATSEYKVMDGWVYFNAQTISSNPAGTVSGNTSTLLIGTPTTYTNSSSVPFDLIGSCFGYSSNSGAYNQGQAISSTAAQRIQLFISNVSVVRAVMEADILPIVGQTYKYIISGRYKLY